jgi:IS30 family transposase
MYNNITREDRACIAHLLRNKESHTYIAAVIGVHRTTILREIERNSENGWYDARTAQRKACFRRKHAKVSFRILDTNTNFRNQVLTHLVHRLSPEQIEGRYGHVSFMTIYRYLERHPHLKVHLRRRGKKRRKYGTKRIPSRYQANKRSIHERPSFEGLGHWEGDTVVGKERIWSILTHVDKTSGFLVADLVRHSSDVVHERVRARMKHVPCFSITYDNGSEFALHKMIERDTGALVYFADAGCPHQRGTNENTNGLLRDYLPKGTSFASITNNDVQRIVRVINDRPRKRLNYLTPREVFENKGVRFKS